jgi:hypothetical protein
MARVGVAPARRTALTGVACLVLAGGIVVTGKPGPADAVPGEIIAASGTVTGIVREVTGEPSPGAHSGVERRHKVLQVGREIVPLAPGSLPGSGDGDVVRVALTPDTGGDRRVRFAATVRTAAATASATARGRRDVHIVLMRPRGVAADKALTAAAAAAAVRRAASYWHSQTGGAVRFRVAGVTKPYVSAHPCSAGAARMWTEALDLLDLPNATGQHVILFAPRAASRRGGCDYGVGTLGLSGGLGLTFVTETTQSLVAHELGHNLGLGHAGALHCRGVQDPRYRSGKGWPAACRREEYGDLLDVMGYSGRSFGEGSLNAVNLDRMGLLPRAVRKIGSPGRYKVRLKPLSGSAGARRAVRIVERSGQTYYVEYRTNTGRDKVAKRNRLRPALGVRVLRRNPSAGGALVLDATPSRRNDYANSFAVGRRFTSASGKLTIRVISTGRTGATVLITNRR